MGPTIVSTLFLFMVLSTAAHLTLLVLFISTWRRHRHRCFALLAIATVFTLLYTIGISASFFLKLDEATAINSYRVGLISAYIGLVFGFWGMLSLLKSYRDHVPIPPANNEERA